MLIGKLMVYVWTPNADFLYVGSALGDLGRHTRKDADGMPEFIHRTQIFQQVLPRSLSQALTAVLSEEIGNIYVATNTDSSLRLHLASCASLLQTVTIFHRFMNANF